MGSFAKTRPARSTEISPGTRVPDGHLTVVFAALALTLRDGERCQLCGGHATHVDHIVPRHLGGSSDESNLRSLCPPCHYSISGRQAVRSEAELIRLPTGVGESL